jgi:hypothetical protein
MEYLIRSARWPSGKAREFGSRIRRFESYPGSQKNASLVVRGILLILRQLF